jgi:hypothetical protein
VSVFDLKRQRKNAKVEPQVANVFTMPALDQTAFEQMLEAAFILQQQSRQSQKKLDPAESLVEIAEVQESLRSLSDASTAAKLIVERLEKITTATAIAVAFLQTDRLEYCAASGTLAPLAGSVVPIPANVAELLQKDKARQSSPHDIRREHLQGDTPNPILFPFYDKTTMPGFLQMSFPETELVAPHQMQSCHVMANLMGEALVRAAELRWKQTLAKEHAALLEALERLKPQLERLTTDVAPIAAEAAPINLEPSPAPLVEGREKSAAELSTEGLPDISNLLEQLTVEPGSANAAQNSLLSLEQKAETPVLSTAVPELTGSQPVSTAESNVSASDAVAQLSSACGQCGFLFSEGESFCGRCGTPRAVAPARDVPQAAPQTSSEPQHTPKFLLTGDTMPAVPEAFPAMPELAAAQATAPVDGSAALAIEPQPAEAEIGGAEPEKELKILLDQEDSAWESSPWTSATKARTWLESVNKTNVSKRWLGRHQGDVSVTISVLVLLLAVLWWSPHQMPQRLRTKAAEPSLTLFERALVGLGLAQPPTVAPTYGGNPDVSVWEDVHTALYYCSGSEQFGKTEAGKIAPQRDAQLDQFEPATRKPCE